MSPPPKHKRREVSVRATTYAKLQELARKNGEQVSTTLDALIRRYLDEQEKSS